jgi:tetratricopeptide (TPR) repeat protein
MGEKMSGDTELPDGVANKVPSDAEEPGATEVAYTKNTGSRIRWSILWRDAKAPIIVVALTLAISAASLAVSIRTQVESSDQYERSQQQALLSIVVSISQENQNSVQSSLRLLADGQEAETIIEDLPKGDVPSVEKYQVGEALEAGGDFQSALTLVQEAAKEASDPVTTADSWREAANILYKISRGSEAESDIAKARNAINAKNLDAPAEEDNIAFTDFYDITLRTGVRPAGSSACKAAADDWNEAQQDMGIFPQTIPSTLESEEMLAFDAANKYCNALLPNPPR